MLQWIEKLGASFRSPDALSGFPLHQLSCSEAAACAVTMDKLLLFLFFLWSHSPSYKAQVKIFSCLSDKADVQINYTFLKCPEICQALLLHNNCCYVVKIAATRTRSRYCTYISWPHRGSKLSFAMSLHPGKKSSNPPFPLSDVFLVLFLQFFYSLCLVGWYKTPPSVVSMCPIPEQQKGWDLPRPGVGSSSPGMAGLLYPGTVSTSKKRLGCSCGGSKARVDLPSSVTPHLSVSE